MGKNTTVYAGLDVHKSRSCSIPALRRGSRQSRAGGAVRV